MEQNVNSRNAGRTPIRKASLHTDVPPLASPLSIEVRWQGLAPFVAHETQAVACWSPTRAIRTDAWNAV